MELQLGPKDEVSEIVLKDDKRIRVNLFIDTAGLVAAFQPIVIWV